MRRKLLGRRKIGAGALLGLVVVMVVAACSGGGATPTPRVVAATPTPTPTPRVVMATPTRAPTSVVEAGPCSGVSEFVLINGRILTMDDNDTIASSVRIESDRIVAVGDVGPVAGDCVIDLGGRPVTPGLIDSHIHVVQPSQAPGHFLSSFETASYIPDLLTKLSDRANSVPSGEFITAVGGLGPPQFAEGRLPTLAELDSAAPDHPVYLQVGFGDPAVTNTLGKEYFEAAGVSVGADGAMGRAAVGPALTVLLMNQTDAEARTAALEYMEYANSVGLTTVIDQGCCRWFGVNLSPDEVHGYQTFYDLWEQGELTVRLRLRFGGGGSPGPDGVLPVVRIREAAMERIGDGDDMLRIVGVGEFTVGGFGQTTGVPFEEAWGQIAELGWSLSQHSASAAEHEVHIAAFEAVNANTPIAELRWSLDHAFEVTVEHLSRLRNIGVGVAVSNTAYLPITRLLGAAPFRDILDSGVQAVATSDSSNIGPLNPWLNIYFMVTGKNVAGELVNDGQQITRLEALRLYTVGSSWFSFEEDRLGSIEAGKLANLVVLSDDYLSVPEEEIKGLSSVLTIVGGKVVYVAEDFSPLKQE